LYSIIPTLLIRGPEWVIIRRTVYPQFPSYNL
jgi:hypothetical protein